MDSKKRSHDDDTLEEPRKDATVCGSVLEASINSAPTLSHLFSDQVVCEALNENAPSVLIHWMTTHPAPEQWEGLFRFLLDDHMYATARAMLDCLPPSDEIGLRPTNIEPPIWHSPAYPLKGPRPRPYESLLIQSEQDASPLGLALLLHGGADLTFDVLSSRLFADIHELLARVLLVTSKCGHNQWIRFMQTACAETDYLTGAALLDYLTHANMRINFEIDEHLAAWSRAPFPSLLIQCERIDLTDAACARGLWRAIHHANDVLAIAILDSRPHPLHRYEYNPFDAAARCGRHKVISPLLCARGSIHAVEQSMALRIAVERKDFKMAKALLAVRHLFVEKNSYALREALMKSCTCFVADLCAICPELKEFLK